MEKRVPAPELTEFLEPYDEHIRALTLELREFILNRFPGANELIYDAYNAVSIAFSLSDRLGDAFCHLAVYPAHVNFGFNRGTELTNVPVRLRGSGQLIRHLPVNSRESFPQAEIESMLEEAFQNAKRRIRLIAPLMQGKIFIMRSAGKKKRPQRK